MNPWIIAARPKTLPAGLGPVILGSALAWGPQFNPLIFILTALSALFLQISSNLINDYYDGVSGADDENRLGPPRATALGLIPAAKVKRSFIITLILSFILGLYLMKVGGLPIIIIGLSSIFFSWAYTGGPFPLSYLGLGEIAAFIFFGPVAVYGTWHLQILPPDTFIPTSVLLIGSAVGLLSSALMGVNNLRDITTDKTHGKKTIATRVGDTAMRFIILSFILFSFVLGLLGLYVHHYRFSFYDLFLILPFIIKMPVWKNLFVDKVKGKELNLILAGVGQYLFLFSITLGLILTLRN